MRVVNAGVDDPDDGVARSEGEVPRGGRPDVRADKSRLLARNAVRCIRATQGRRAAFLAWLVVMLWSSRLLVAASLRAVVRPSISVGPVRARLAGWAAAVGAWREISRSRGTTRSGCG